VAIFDDEDLVGLSSKGLRNFRDQCVTLQMRGDFTQVILVQNRPDLWLKDGKRLPECSDWHVIERTPIAQHPEDAVIHP
jgi:hypothetical protein